MKKLTETLAQGAYQSIIRKTQKLRQFNELLQQALPEELQTHCRVMNVQDNQLTVQVDSSAWATQLQYRIPEILSCLQSMPALQHISHIKLRVYPHYLSSSDSLAPQPRPMLTEKQKNQLRSTACYIKNQALKAALLRLVGKQ